MYGFEMLGRERPMTETSLRAAWRTASPAPGTAGAEIAIISCICGYALRMVWVSAKALSRSSSLGRIAVRSRPGYFSAILLLIHAIHSFWFAALRAPVMI